MQLSRSLTMKATLCRKHNPRSTLYQGNKDTYIYIINYPEFTNKNDIIGVQGSKMDDIDNDTIAIEGYQICNHNRKEYSRYRSDGIAIIVKKENV